MKQLAFLILILVGGSDINNLDSSSSFDELWEELAQLENKALYKSAYEIVEKIKEKAEREGRSEHYLKALIYKAKLSQHIEDRDPAEYIMDLENELKTPMDPAFQAILHSILGELYHNYGLNNIYRFSNRSNTSNKSKEGYFNSLVEIQDRSFFHFFGSLNYQGGASLGDFDILFHVRDTEKWFLEAKDLKEFIAYRALDQFMNSSAFVSKLSSDFYMDREEFFADANSFQTLDLNTYQSRDHKLEALKLFQKLSKSYQLDDESRIKLNIRRIQFVNDNYSLVDKDELYISALTELIRSKDRYESTGLAYVKLIEFHLNKAYQSNKQNTETDHFEEAFRWIQKFNKAHKPDVYSASVDAQRMRLMNKYLDIDMEMVIPSEKDFLAYVNYRNLDCLNFRLIRLDREEFNVYQNINRNEDRLAFLMERSSYTDWKQDLPELKDRRFHGVEIPMKALNYGSYVLLASDDDLQNSRSHSRISMHLFHVSDLAYITPNHSRGSLKIRVVDRSTGKVLEAVKTELLSYHYDRRRRTNEWKTFKSKTTDENGIVNFNYDSYNFSIRLSNGNDVLDLRNSHAFSNEIKDENYHRVEFFTDRSIYRPGQRIHFKALSISKNRITETPQLVPNSEYSVLFRDMNNQIIDKQDFKSNEYGSFSGSFHIPEGIALGRLSLGVESRQHASYHAVRVEEYKRPKIKAEFSKLDKAYKQGDRVLVSGKVGSYSGLDVQNAQVEYRIYRSKFIRPYFDHFRSYRPYNSNKQLIAQASTTSGSDGSFSFEFDSSKAMRSNEAQYYEIECQIIDITGESIDISKSFSLSPVPYRLEYELPTYVFESELSDVRLKCLNLENELQKVDLRLEIFQMECPKDFKRKKYWNWIDQFLMDDELYEKSYPLDHKGDYFDYDKWEQKSLLKRVELSAQEFSIKEFTDLKRGFYKIIISTEDEGGNSLERVHYLQISDHKKAALPGDALWMSMIDRSYEPGDELSFKVNTPFRRFSVFYELRHNGSLIEKGKLTRKNKEFKYRILEKDRGGLSLDLIMIHHNRVYRQSRQIEVSWSNKQLDFEIISMSDHSQPGMKESLKLKVKSKSGKLSSSEILAAMYDSSLDAFVSHNWKTDWYPRYFNNIQLISPGFLKANKFQFAQPSRKYYETRIQSHYPRLNWFGFYMSSRRNGMYEFDEAVMVKSVQAGAVTEAYSTRTQDQEEINSEDIPSELPNISLRDNFEETLFFYPEIKVDENGEMELEFTMNDALTEWRLMMMVHDKQARFGYHEAIIQSSLPLMLEAQLPRFVRQGDEIVLNAKLSNLTDSTLNTLSELELFDARSGKDIISDFVYDRDTELSNTLAPGESKLLEWRIHVPDSFISQLGLRMRSTSGKYSDAVQHVLPVLSKRIFVTESKVLHANPDEEKDFFFEALRKAENSNTLENYQFRVEYQSDPSWLVLKALPALLSDDARSSTEIFDAIFGNYVAAQLITNNDLIREYIRSFDDENIQGPLSVNEDLKLKNIGMTPWLRDALTEEKNMRRLKLFTNGNQREYELKTLINSLKERQLDNGGFSWMPGGRDNWYITQYILEGLARLDAMGISWQAEMQRPMVERAVRYVDDRVVEYYEKQDSVHKYIHPRIAHYMYLRSAFSNVSMQESAQKALDSYLEQYAKIWQQGNSYIQSLLGIAFSKYERDDLSSAILASLLERRIEDDELGSYWNDQAGYYWFDLNIEKQACLIEFFELMNTEDDILNSMRLWLLKNKQVNAWKTSKETSAAVFSFFNAPEMKEKAEGRVRLFFPEANTEIAVNLSETQEINQAIELKDVTQLEKLSLENNSNRTSWGALHWQYFEDIDKIGRFEGTPLTISKSIGLLRIDGDGESIEDFNDKESLVPGDKIRTRIEIQVDRPMEYIILKDMRASGTEALNVLSQYKWQDGLSYYESTEDLASFFYIDFLPKGNFVFEYDQVITHYGEYDTGIATIQSMYAPEFSSHSSNTRLRARN